MTGKKHLAMIHSRELAKYRKEDEGGWYMCVLWDVWGALCELQIVQAKQFILASSCWMCLIFFRETWEFLERLLSITSVGTVPCNTGICSDVVLGFISTGRVYMYRSFQPHVSCLLGTEQLHWRSWTVIIQGVVGIITQLIPSPIFSDPLQGFKQMAFR